MIFLKSNLTIFQKKKKNIKKLSLLFRIDLYLNINRFFYSRFVNTVQCLAIIKSKKSKLYNCRCPNKAKVSDFCGRHNKQIKISKMVKKNKLFMSEIRVKCKCLGLIKSGLKCNRMVLNNYCFQHKKRVTFIDLFSGIGSFHYVLKKFDGKCILAVDNDVNCNNLYYKNFGVESKGDVLNINVEKIPSYDILCGGFPCQPFSTAGLQKGFLDKRSSVIWKIFEILNKTNPRFVILENVKGLLKHNRGESFSIIRNNLEKNLYFVKYKVLNTKVITNIPHNRERLFIIAFKNYSDYINFDFDFDFKNSFRVKYFLELNIPKKYYYTKNSKIYDVLKKNVIKSVDNDVIYQYRRGIVRENKSKVCPTLVAQMGTGGHNVPIILDSIGIRKLTPRECLNLQGFLNYEIEGFSDSIIYKCCGNSITINVLDLIFKKLFKRW